MLTVSIVITVRQSWCWDVSNSVSNRFVSVVGSWEIDSYQSTTSAFGREDLNQLVSSEGVRTTDSNPRLGKISFRGERGTRRTARVHLQTFSCCTFLPGVCYLVCYLLTLVPNLLSQCSNLTIQSDSFNFMLTPIWGDLSSQSVVIIDQTGYE